MQQKVTVFYSKAKYNLIELLESRRISSNIKSRETKILIKINRSQFNSIYYANCFMSTNRVRILLNSDYSLLINRVLQV